MIVYSLKFDEDFVLRLSVVVVENVIKRLAHHGECSSAERLAIIRDAAVEVRTPTVFGQLIIMIVYLPILTLEGVEGKLFRPMAMTVILALAGSMVLSLTLMPVLAAAVSIVISTRPVLPARSNWTLPSLRR